MLYIRSHRWLFEELIEEAFQSFDNLMQLALAVGMWIKQVGRRISIT